jgi:hypothetical protein
MKEAELLIISAETVGHGREISYEVEEFRVNNILC